MAGLAALVLVLTSPPQTLAMLPASAFLAVSAAVSLAGFATLMILWRTYTFVVKRAAERAELRREG